MMKIFHAPKVTFSAPETRITVHLAGMGYPGCASVNQYGEKSNLVDSPSALL
jgi:hypothetical protein